jgi:hypothetical protein
MNQIHVHALGLKRSLKGENSNRSILSSEVVIAMRNDYKLGIKVKDLCKKYNIKYITCWFIVKEINYQI